MDFILKKSAIMSIKVQQNSAIKATNTSGFKELIAPLQDKNLMEKISDSQKLINPTYKIAH